MKIDLSFTNSEARGKPWVIVRICWTRRGVKRFMRDISNAEAECYQVYQLKIEKIGILRLVCTAALYSTREPEPQS